VTILTNKKIKTRPKLATIMKVYLARKFVHSHIKVMLQVMGFMVALTKMMAKTIVFNSLLL
jgi:DNA-binding cell septation regulator SpoVG